LTSQQGNLSDISSQLANVSDQQQQYSNLINAAPSALDNLASNIPDRSNLNVALKNSLQDLYKSNKKTASSYYEPINNSNIRFDTQEGGSSFPNYQSAASELLAKRENMTNLFGNDADLGNKLNSELNQAQNFLSNKNTYGNTLNESISRVQNLGRLSAAASAQGNRYEAQLLGNLRDGLSTDIDNNLRISGRSDLADQLQGANDYYKKNVVPFWQNNEIRKSATTKGYIPQQAKLAKALHDSNNQTVLDQLPTDSKNAALYQLMTGGRGTSSGYANMTPEDIARSYAKIPVDSKRLIAQYNPRADSYFENLSNFLDQHDELNANKNLLGKQAKEQQANVQKLTQNLQKYKEKKFGVDKQSGYGAKALSDIIKGSGALLYGAGAITHPHLIPLMAAGPLLGRNLAKTLTDPELINAYINRTGLMPVNKSYLAKALSKALPTLTTPAINK
jgi:hypothetical protein